MGKYLLCVSYTAEGTRGLIKDGAAARVEYVKEFVAGMGGKVESFNFAIGKHDAYVVVDADESAILAASMAVGASGAVNLTTVKLVTPEEADAAIGKVGDYRPPGA